MEMPDCVPPTGAKAPGSSWGDEIMQIKGTGLYRVLMASAAVAAITVAQSAYAQDAATGGATALERLTVEGGKGGKPAEGEATGRSMAMWQRRRARARRPQRRFRRYRNPFR